MRVQRVPEPPSTRRRQRGRVSPGCCAGASLRLTNCSTTWSKSHSRPLNDSTHGLRPTEPAPVARRVGRELGPRCRNGCAQAPSRAWRRSGRAPPPAPSLGFTDPLRTGDRRRQCRRQRLVAARTDRARRVAVRRLRQADRHRSVRRLHRRPGVSTASPRSMPRTARDDRGWPRSHATAVRSARGQAAHAHA